MKLGIYSIRDVETGFLTPIVDVSDGSAERSFCYAAHDTKSLFFVNPNDYALFKIGYFDSDSGLIEAFPLPQKVCEASKFFKEDKENEVTINE